MMKNKRIFLHLLILTGCIIFALSANDNHRFNFGHALDQDEKHWVDSVFNSMTEDERLGQLFMLRAHSDKDSVYEKQVEDLIRRFKPGGLCFFQGTPEKQALLTNRYQAASPQLPLMISMDAETGLGMRLKESCITYPKQLMLGAIQDNKMVYDMGREIARQCRRLGVHISFSPVADVNNNAANPVINDRSFGEDRYNVASKCFQYMMGLQDGGVMACAKHFPGHGDTNVDSHLDLPVIPWSRERLDSLELFPFRVLSQFGIGSFMVAHLSVPALDARANRPTTLSRNTVTNLLRQQIGFEGLIFTDAMEMQGVAKYFAPGEADVEALRAGNDIVLLPGNMDSSLQALHRALNGNTIDRAQLYESVKRVLRAKYRLGLTVPQRIKTDNIRAEINTPEAYLLKRRLIENALTLVRDRPGLAGFKDIEKYHIASLALGDTNRTIFQNFCGRFAPIDFFNADKLFDSTQQAILLDTLKKYDVLLVSLHNTRSRAMDNFGLTSNEIDFIKQLNSQHTVVLTVFGNPYSLRYFDDVPVLLEAYNEDPMTQELAAQALFGANDIRGTLPVTVTQSARFGQGIQVVFPEKRLGYELPEAVGMNSDTLALMDDLAAEIIRSGASPGCQILVARNNKVIWNKAYGYYTYEQLKPVTTETVFDMASVTKVGASTLSVMRTLDQGQLSLDVPLKTYIPETAGSNKADLTLRELMAHHAGLQPWIPFYQRTLENGLPDRHIYHSEPDADSEIPVAPGMFMDNNWVDTIWNTIYRSDLRTTKGYKYSDLGLYLTAKSLANINKMPLDQYADQNFYKPLGLANTTFCPWKKGWVDRCAPTEEDQYFRRQRLQGYVHDMGAAMLGGVSGHAGLFSNANDLAKIFQMLLNGGTYAGHRYVNTATVKEFTTRYPASTRRGIGFDMKELDPKETQNMCELAGPNTFGHMGFTGICVWADPDQQLIYIFISNRTYPTMENNKLINNDYRPKLQRIVYRSIQ